MTTSKTPRLILMSAIVLAVVGTHARAEQTADVELPPVIVEGATLEAKAVSKPKAKVQPVEVESLASEPAPPEKKFKKAAQPSAPSTPKPVQAANEPVDVPPSETSGTATVNGQETVPGIALEKTGSAVSVVTGEDLRQRQIRNGAEALRSLPGVSVSGQGGAQGITVVRLRGGESRHTLVLIDGVEVNSGSGAFFDFSTLLVDDIAQIEVIKGPQSGLYSSGALGGVINIITRGGKGPLTFRGRAEGGSFNARDGMIGMSGGTDRAHASLTLSGRKTDGFNIAPMGTEKDGGEFSTFNFTGGVMVFDNLKLDGTLRRAHRAGDRDGTNDVVNGLFVASDEKSTFASDVSLGSLTATLDTFDQTWIHKFYVRGTETENRDIDRGPFSSPGGQLSRNISTMNEYGYLSTYRLDGPQGLPVRHFITGLVEHRREEFEQPLIPLSTFARDRDSVAGEIRGEYFDGLNLTGNVRHDNNEGFEDATTWRVAGSWVTPVRPVRLHSSIGTGIKYPSFSEQFGVFSGFVANPNLIPEKSLGWDAGVETTLFNGKAVIDVTYFHANLQNEIDFNFVPPAVACGGVPFCFIPFNRAGESTREGIEVSARAAVADGLTVGLAYTYLKAREDNGLEEVRRAPHSGRGDVNYTFLEGRANVNLAAIYNGRMQDLGFSAITFSSQRVALDEYWLVNLGASYKVTPSVELYGRVENLLDEKYQEVYGFQTAGISAYAGVRFSYEEPSTKDWAKYK